MASYGWTASDADAGAIEAWRRQERLVIGPAQHGLSAGHLRAIRDIEQLPADQWLRRFAKAPGIRKDARAWYGIETWLETQGTTRISAADLTARIDRREFSLEIGWSPEFEDTLLVTLPVNPASASTFKSVHFETPNVLLSIKVDNPHSVGGTDMRIGEIQSDWHQEGTQSGWQADPIAWKQSHKASVDAIEDVAEEATARVFRDRDLMAAITPALLRNIRKTELPADERVAERCLWSLLRTIGAGEKPIPASLRKGLAQEQAHILSEALSAFTERHRIYTDWRHSPVPEAPFRTNWPRLGLIMALAYAASARDPRGLHRFRGVVLPDGDRVANDSRADEPVCGLEWKLDQKAGLVRIHVETSDENGNRLARPAIEAKPTGLASVGCMESLLGDIEELLGRGRKSGILSRDWIDRNYAFEDSGILWRNQSLRRFYDHHLPRELKEVARSLGADAVGSAARLTPASRTLLEKTFQGLDRVEPEDFGSTRDAEADTGYEPEDTEEAYGWTP